MSNRFRIVLVASLGTLLACSAGVDGDSLEPCFENCAEPGDDLSPDGLESLTQASAANFQDGVYPSAAYNGTTDTTLQQYSPSLTDGSNVTMKADFDYPSASRKSVVGLMKFDVSSIPTTAKVTSAKLTVNVTNLTQAAGYQLYALLRGFSESQASWNLSSSSVKWAGGGARGTTDRSTASMGTLAPTKNGQYTVTLNAAGIAAVQKWVQSPASNFGFAIDTSSNPDGVQFDSSNAATAANRPRLSIAYTTEVADPPADSGVVTPPADSGVVTPPPSNGAGAGSAPIGTPCPAGAKATVTPSMSTSAIQTALNNAGTGATICFAPGLYRLTATLSPKQGQRLHGEAGAILNGAVVLSSWASDGGDFRADSVTFTTGGPKTAYAPFCEDNVNYPCAYGEDVFFDGKPLTRAPSRDAVGPGTFYNNYSTKQVFIGDNPAGHKVEIGSVSAGVRVGANDVTLEGLTVEMFAQLPDRGGIEVNPGVNNMTIQNCESRFNHGSGFQSGGTNTTVRYNRFHDNGQLGMAISSTNGAVVDHNDLIHNNIAGFWRIDGSAGGIKVDLATNVAVTNNLAKDNNNHGIWYDEGADYATITGNVVDNNFASGILFEVSRNAKINNNIVTSNGLGDPTARGHLGCKSLGCSGGLQVSNCENVEIANNTISGNIQGISLTMTSRSPRTSSYTIPNLTGINAHDNTITLATGVSGLVFNSGPAGFDPYAASSNNKFVHNTYKLPSLTSASFYWQRAAGDKARWQGYGLDTTGVFVTQ